MKGIKTKQFWPPMNTDKGMIRTKAKHLLVPVFISF